MCVCVFKDKMCYWERIGGSIFHSARERFYLAQLSYVEYVLHSKHKIEVEYVLYNKHKIEECLNMCVRQRARSSF